MIPAATYFLSVRELSARIRAKQLSPVALTEGCLDRLQRMGSHDNAVVTVTRDRP